MPKLRRNNRSYDVPSSDGLNEGGFSSGSTPAQRMKAQGDLKTPKQSRGAHTLDIADYSGLRGFDSPMQPYHVSKGATYGRAPYVSSTPDGILLSRRTLFYGAAGIAAAGALGGGGYLIYRATRNEDSGIKIVSVPEDKVTTLDTYDYSEEAD